MRLAPLAMLLWLQACLADYAWEGQPYTLECGEVGEVLRWYLHGDGRAYEYDALSREAGTTVSQEGGLVFRNVSASDEGQHLCVFQDGSGGLQAAAVAMRVRTLIPDDLWETRYKTKFLRAVLATVVFASVLSWGCLVGRYRFVEEGTDDIALADKGHFNTALEMEGSLGPDPARY